MLRYPPGGRLLLPLTLGLVSLSFVQLADAETDADFCRKLTSILASSNNGFKDHRGAVVDDFKYDDDYSHSIWKAKTVFSDIDDCRIEKTVVDQGMTIKYECRNMKTDPELYYPAQKNARRQALKCAESMKPKWSYQQMRFRGIPGRTSDGQRYIFSSGRLSTESALLSLFNNEAPTGFILSLQGPSIATVPPKGKRLCGFASKSMTDLSKPCIDSDSPEMVKEDEGPTIELKFLIYREIKKKQRSTDHRGYAK